MSPSPQAQAKILVVDDDLHTRDLLRELCESQGHRVQVASEGHGALEQIRTFAPELVLLDVMIPGIDGFDVLAQIRAEPQTARLPVIILTANTTLEAKIRGIELCADDFITKPFRIGELTERIGAALSARAAQMRRVEEKVSRSENPSQAIEGYPQLRATLIYELARAKRYHRPLAALLLCIENFDSLRSQLSRGDLGRFTAELAAKLRDGIRESDRLFRIDVDVFAVILPETEAGGAEAARARVLESLSRHRDGLWVSAGVGVVAETANPEELMRAAQRDLASRRSPPE